MTPRSKANQWHTDSGIWQVGAEPSGFVLSMTIQGHTVSDEISTADIEDFLLTGSTTTSEGIYPSEFKYCPHSGEDLIQRLPSSVVTWIGPSGSLEINASVRSTPGLRQTPQELKLARKQSRSPQADADQQLDLPPPGDYEFLSVCAGTLRPVLLALDPSKGMIRAWFPATKNWTTLSHAQGGQLADCPIDRQAWRCEAVLNGPWATLYFPTVLGLARLTPDVLGQCFEVEYLGAGEAVGAPISFDDRVWMPTRSTGGITFVAVSLQGQEMALPVTQTPPDLRVEQTPVSDNRMAIWICNTGQLLVQKSPSGEKQAHFIPWPLNVSPCSKFGSPYLSRDGSLWQLCFDSHADSYIYLQLGMREPMRHVVTAPRLCTGSVNFRFATRFKSDPWLEPEQGDDGRTNELVYPLVESLSHGSVVGLKIHTSAGIADVLVGNERQRCVLISEGDESGIQFGVITVPELWRTRVFVHDGVLWCYHPTLTKLEGWELE